MFKNIKKLLFTFCLLAALLSLAHFAMAATAPDVGLEAAAGTGLSAANDPRIIAANIIRIVLGFLGIIAVGLIIYAGWLWMTAEGEAEKVEKAKKILIGAVIGLTICLASFAIASFILNNLLDATGTGTTSTIPGGGTVTPGGGTPTLPGEGQPCLKDSLDTQCVAGRCAAGLSCSATDCLCKKTNQPGEGQSCDGNTNLAGCQAVDCADSLACSSNDNCSCIKTPLIAWVSPIDASSTPNGAIGNFITIGGRYFGTTTGQVIFTGDPNNAGDDKAATFPNQVNPLCVSFWQDNQIIAVVPAGAVSGPIKVIDSKNYFDTTDNNRGARLKDFLINNIKRPGLCLADPPSGGLADKFTLQGSGFNLSPHSVFFGSGLSAIAANNIASWTNTSVKATVPNIKDGRNSVFVQTNSINSNDLIFTVRNSADANPAIEYIEPSKGPSGQYITIYGRNFKTYNAQKSSVKFYLPADPNTKINADIDFPEACRNNWWHDTYIIVKVPKVNSLGAYKVEVTNIDGKASAPADFTINNETPAPGLCSLNPNNGPVGWPVTANGERFGASQGTGRVQYFNNKDGAVRGWADKKIDTNVPAGSISGPFRIIDGQGYISNPLPFRVGKCSSSSECESGEECCGGGTYWSGICRAAGTCAQGSPVACGFGWTFSTESGQCAVNQEKCDIPNAAPGSAITFHCCARGQCNRLTGQCDGCTINKPDQCDGDLQCCSTGGCKDSDGDGKTECSDGEACSSYGLSQCSSSYFCPNSPGKCSTYGGGAVIEIGSCDYSCNNFSACKTDLCEYRASIDKCLKKNQTCGLPKIVNYMINGAAMEATAECLPYSNKNRWIMKISTSCPVGWTSISGGRCVENNTACSACGTGFKCLKETDISVDGSCVVEQSLCPVGSTCNKKNKCVKSDSASCECCCRIGYDSEDCCSPLKCQGKCGSDITANTNTYGKCSGCGSVGATQAEHNAACNCSGTSGKFCLIDTANPAGVCADCAQISDAAICSGQGEGSCCVDAKKNNACRGGAAPYATGNPAYNYCAYYECSSGSCSNTPVAASNSPTYKTKAECDNKCAPAAQFGNTCFNSATTTQSCDINKCVGFACLNEDGKGASAQSCGTCCCDPYANPDTCKNINSLLTCKANQGSCSGEKRGLCCGCSKDNECGDANAVGCGGDTCCQARPKVINTAPGSGANDVCRNGLIQATFDQAMQINTFNNNVIVAGDYGASQCPANTRYLTAAYKPSIFAKIKFWLAKLPLVNKVFGKDAQASDTMTGNFCTVAGSVSGYVKADKTTVMEFKPQQILEAKRKYYVIIKGDSDVTDAVRNGVLNQAGIGLKSVDEKVFNGVNFKGKIWSFITKENTAANNGICLVNGVSIDPAGYLFNTAVNDPADDNGADDQTIRDSDKIFRATAYFAANQPIAPVENVYNWRWDWNIDNKAVVKFKNGDNALDNRPEQTIVAQNVKEANTLLHAKATIIEDKVNKSSTVGQSKESAAEVYVFLCANPWPTYKADGSWEPWRDAFGNCTATTGSCSGTNFALYYCRDAGEAGTADDLPAILSDTTVIRGSSAEQNILKEFYFFREGAPNIGGVNLTVATNNEIMQGGKAGLVWQAISVPSDQQLDKYLVYYGTKPGSYEQSIPAATPGATANPFIVSNLTNGVKYYFAVTARYKSGAESVYSNEVSFTPADSWAPRTPEGLSGEAGTGKAIITWTANIDDTVIYKIYYGATSGSLGASVNLEKSKCSVATGKCGVTINNLTAGVIYYFAATALDLKANESNKSGEINLTIK
ncbi:MAG: IPT/TIG domain-containing protein [Patescibacteria group bacterium]|nr:IPT/TIG domain-containing protein [Patescibacteria group bacterium]